jgi:hypothetical protein
VSAEEDLYSLACDDMPVTGDEVREAMDAWAHELAEKIRALRDSCDYDKDSPEYKHMTGAADLIDPKKEGQ